MMCPGNPKTALKTIPFFVICGVLLIVFKQCNYSGSVDQNRLSFAPLTTELNTETNPTMGTERYRSKKPTKETNGPPTRKIVYGTWRERTPNYWSVLNRSYVEEHIQRPLIGNYQCSDVLCSEFLTTDDWKSVDKCLNKLAKNGAKTLLPKCHFRNSTSKVLLLSYPGSGNTWVRGLLEKGSGICTGERAISDS